MSTPYLSKLMVRRGVSLAEPHHAYSTCHPGSTGRRDPWRTTVRSALRMRTLAALPGCGWDGDSRDGIEMLRWRPKHARSTHYDRAALSREVSDGQQCHVAEVAGTGDPARAGMLHALMDGRVTASESPASPASGRRRRQTTWRAPGVAGLLEPKSRAAPPSGWPPAVADDGKYHAGGVATEPSRRSSRSAHACRCARYLCPAGLSGWRRRHGSQRLWSSWRRWWLDDEIGMGCRPLGIDVDPWWREAAGGSVLCRRVSTGASGARLAAPSAPVHHSLTRADSEGTRAVAITPKAGAAGREPFGTD
jgi:hypothetical protein